MSQISPDTADWPVLLGQLIAAKQAVHEHDADDVESWTIPRVKATEDEVAALEQRVGERIDACYRQFLLHANGWPRVLYDLSLFGIPEFDGQGDWLTANEMLGIYRDQSTLSESGLEAGGVMPVAAGEGMTDLIVIVRTGWKDAGTVVWFDGTEYDRWPNFTEFFKTLIANEQAHADKLAASDNDA
ncbi:MAG: SMI1/KNR4 family protein [Stackebrandtia sp.]